MTDKEIRALIEKRRKDWRYGNSVEAKYKAEECDDILELIDSLHEEPKFKVGDIIKHKHYEHWETEEVIEVTAQGVRTNIGWLSFPDEWELVEEPKKCMYTNEHYTEEDRKVLCEDCEEDCEYAKKVEPSIVIVLNGQRHRQVWHKGCFSKKECKEKCSLYGSCQRCSIDLCMIFFHDPHCHFEEEPVSEELEEAAVEWFNSVKYKSDLSGTLINAFKAGAQWQKEKEYTCYEEAFEDGALWKRYEMMKDAIDAIVHIDAGNYPYIPQIELYDYDKDVPLAKEGDKYKVVLIKEE